MIDLDSKILLKEKLQKPGLYKVIFLNDDYTPMGLVVAILEEYFGKSESSAEVIMQRVHEKGSAIAGIYTKDICLSKCEAVEYVVKELGFPLKVVVEEVS